MPLADGTVMKAPEDINDNSLVLMADIFPTGRVHEVINLDNPY